MNKNRNNKRGDASSPEDANPKSTAPSNPKEKKQDPPEEGSIRKVRKSSSNSDRFDDNDEVTAEEAISQDNKKSADEND